MASVAKGQAVEADTDKLVLRSGLDGSGSPLLPVLLSPFVLLLLAEAIEAEGVKAVAVREDIWVVVDSVRGRLNGDAGRDFLPI